MTKKYKFLSDEQVNHFLEKGYIVLKGAFTKEKAAEWTETIWTRLGLDPNDKSTWTKERIHMPHHRRELVESFAPAAWEAMKDLLGGVERIDPESSSWSDAFIFNFGTVELEKLEKDIAPQDFDNWHIDGDFFVHYLDSPEQALLVIPIYSDIETRGGGTFITPDGINMIAKYLAEHPEGVLPTGLSFTPSTTTAVEPKDDPYYWSHLEEVKKCTEFVEIAGEIGDVVLMHPLMLHSASKNYTRKQRIITNPPASLKEPFNFNRENPDDFSLVELKTLKALGVDKLDFKITTERRRIIPKRLIEANKRLEEEKIRLQKLSSQMDRLQFGTAAQPVAVA